jgi:SAM-dependent methyltransferase
LDAGCGIGRWALELAARRPYWYVTGVDLVEEFIVAAQTAGKRLGLSNASFVHSDFLNFQPFEKFDAILSIASAHYLVESGGGKELFCKFSFWLKPGGSLLLLGPRRKLEMPLAPFLPHLPRHEVFSREDLLSLCNSSGLHVELLFPCIGRFGTWAKQINRFAAHSRVLALTAYPLQLFLAMIDRANGVDADQQSSSWMLIAKRL